MTTALSRRAGLLLHQDWSRHSEIGGGGATTHLATQRTLDSIEPERARCGAAAPIVVVRQCH
jgi:hypothetical protein